MEKTITFTMEDALISPLGLAVLTGAGLMEGVQDAEGMTNAEKGGAIMHGTEVIEIVRDTTKILAGVTNKPLIDTAKLFYAYAIPLDNHGDIAGTPIRLNVGAATEATLSTKISAPYQLDFSDTAGMTAAKEGDLYMLDYYYESEDYQAVTQINIDAENFAGNYYLEASTLFRNKDGKDLPAEFIIPNCDIQSNFTFSMAATGDPSELMRLAA